VLLILLVTLWQNIYDDDNSKISKLTKTNFGRL